MNLVEPSVHLIARPKVNMEAMMFALREMGADPAIMIDHMMSETSDVTDAQHLIEFAGRMCYRSWEPGLNKNVTKVREDQREYLENILNVGHGSVLEHAQYTFVINNCSRVFTHEIVRHRVGVAISQESLRFVRLDDLNVWMPQWAQDDLVFSDKAKDLIVRMEAFQLWMAEHFKLDVCQECGNEESHPQHSDGPLYELEWDAKNAHTFRPMPFSRKKEMTSFMRRFAPEGLGTRMVWSANVRALRHVIEMRTPMSAEEEMRIIARQLARIMIAEAPMLFGDYIDDGNGGFTTKSRKV